MTDTPTIRHAGPEPLRAPMFHDGKRQLVVAGIGAVLFYTAEVVLTFYALSLLDRLKAAVVAEDQPLVERIASHMIAVSQYGFVEYVLVIAAIACFFAAMYGQRKAMMGLGRGTWEFGYAWTVGATIVPVLNLYRPWVGLGEIDRVVTHAARTGRIDEDVTTEFSGATLLLGIVLVAGSLATRAIGSMADDMPEATTPAETLQYLDRMADYGLTAALILAAIAATLGFYLVRQLIKLRQVERAFNVM